MKQRLPDHVKPGDVITVDHYNALLDAIKRLDLNPGTMTGIEMHQTLNGTALSVKPVQRYIAKTTSVITARVGTTPGTGTVKQWILDPYSGAGGTLIDTTNEISVFSYSSAAGGIASGKYCYIEQDMSGNWWVISAEC